MSKCSQSLSNGIRGFISFKSQFICHLFREDSPDQPSHYPIFLNGKNYCLKLRIIYLPLPVGQLSNYRGLFFFISVYQVPEPSSVHSRCPKIFIKWMNGCIQEEEHFSLREQPEQRNEQGRVYNKSAKSGETYHCV